jgi:hypothetical protein
MRQRMTVIVFLGILIAAGACTRLVERPASVPELTSAAGRRAIVGFVMQSGAIVHVAPSDRLWIQGDSLVIKEVSIGLLTADTFRVADIRYVRVRQDDWARTAAAVILVPVGVLAVLAVTVLASSCPFIYAFDGTDFIPSAEPLAGAVSAGLARTDLSELEGLVEVDGTYRVIIANEIDETQYVDAFHLVTVDHPANTTVVADRSGMPRLLHDAQPPVRAHDHAGADLLPVLRSNDDIWWPGDGMGPVFSRNRTRDTLTFAFRRPAAGDSATLLVHARNDVWGAYMLKRMLQLWGGQVDQWYQMLDGSPALRASNEEWVLREETWLLRLWVREDAGWRAQEVVMGGGPYISELQSIPVDLSGVSGDEVQLRLHPPQGYWRIDYVALAPSSIVVDATHELHPSEPAMHSGVDVRELLRENDGNYLVMPNIGDRVELRFAAPPPPAAGFVRTVFARTSGYYRVHTPRTGSRNAAQLDSIWLTPGFVVDFARREYLTWRNENPGAPLYPTRARVP